MSVRDYSETSLRVLVQTTPVSDSEKIGSNTKSSTLSGLFPLL